MANHKIVEIVLDAARWAALVSYELAASNRLRRRNRLYLLLSFNSAPLHLSEVETAMVADTTISMPRAPHKGLKKITGIAGHP
jgi:hypothetical protein